LSTGPAENESAYAALPHLDDGRAAHRRPQQDETLGSHTGMHHDATNPDRVGRLRHTTRPVTKQRVPEATTAQCRTNI
jgi:hypothetical protein